MQVLTQIVNEREQWASRQKRVAYHQILHYLEFFATVLLIAVVYMHYDKLTALTKSVMAQWLTRM
jgi:hypothetical protein